LALASSNEPLNLGRFYTSPDQIRPKIVDRWRAFVHETSQKHHPVFAPWHALAALKPEEFAARAPVILGELALRSTDDPNQRINALQIGRLLEPMPVSMKQAARAYGDLLAEIEAKWQKARAASTQPAGAKPIEALPDAQEEELRQVLYAAGAPAALTTD